MLLDIHGNNIPSQVYSHMVARIKNARTASDARITEQSTLIKQMQEGEFDFIDFGTSRGDSIHFAMMSFDTENGIGIDINKKN